MLGSTGPWHSGELLVQARVGKHPLQVDPPIYNALPPQHAAFYPLLPTLYVGFVDNAGQPWATVLCGAGGRTGFVTCPNARTVDVAAAAGADDPLHAALAVGAPLALLGLHHATRRRNRANGRVASVRADGFLVSVDQAFGNCPQYITKRDFVPASAVESAGADGRDGGAASAPSLPTAVAGARRAASGDAPAASVPHTAQPAGAPLSDAAIDLIERSDTHFIASSAARLAPSAAAGCDVSHRGGRPGFVRVRAGGAVLDVPDFSGNFYFNTLGNLEVDARCGLAFPDFATGDVLHVAGTAVVDWGGPRVSAFAGAQRLLTITVTDWRHRRGALPIRAHPGVAPVPSPLVAGTGDWPAADAGVAAAAAADAWRPVVVTAVRDETATVRSLDLRPTDAGAAFPPHVPGQHIRLRIHGVGGDSDGVERCYTITSPPGAGAGGLTISVRRQGPVSSFLHEHARVGAPAPPLLFARGPAGRFCFDAASPRPAVLVSAGVGVTPMLAMLEALLPAGGARPTPAAARGLLWVHVARNGAEHAFRDRAAALCDAAGVPTLVAYTAPRPGVDVPGVHFNFAGRLGGDALLDAVGGGEAARGLDWYACGPGEWWAGVKTALRRAGVPSAQLRAERFVGGPRAGQPPPTAVVTEVAAPGDAEPPPPPIEEAHAVRVTFARSGVEVIWTGGGGGGGGGGRVGRGAAAPTTLLEAAEAAGLHLPYSCRGGACGSCAAPLLRGRAAYLPSVPSSDARVDAEERGEVLLCCAVPRAGAQTTLRGVRAKARCGPAAGAGGGLPVDVPLRGGRGGAAAAFGAEAEAEGEAPTRLPPTLFEGTAAATALAAAVEAPPARGGGVRTCAPGQAGPGPHVLQVDSDTESPATLYEGPTFDA